MSPSDFREDEWIRDALRSFSPQVPPGLDNRVSRRLRRAAVRPQRPETAWRRRLGAAAAASLVLAAILLTIFGDGEAGTGTPPPRSPIQTRFAIPGKNIKIVWVQRQDFRLPATRGEQP